MLRDAVVGLCSAGERHASRNLLLVGRPHFSRAACSIIGEAMNSIMGNDAPALETLKATEQKVEALFPSDSGPKP